jgi:hypothetical protein
LAAETATWATRTARATGVTIAARTAGTTRTTARPIATRATARTTAAATVVTRLTRRRGQDPAHASARDLAAARAVIAIRAFVLLVGRGLQAAQPARLGRAAAIAEATTAATAATTAIAITATSTAAALVAPATATAAATRSHDAIERVVELAHAGRAGRPLLALEHAHQAHAIDVGPDDIERLDQTRGALRGQREHAGDRFGHRFRSDALGGLGRARIGAAAEHHRREFGQGLHGERGGSYTQSPAIASADPGSVQFVPAVPDAEAETSTETSIDTLTRATASNAALIWPLMHRA